jgi:integrase
MTSLLYGAGLCLLECLGLRVKDRDFASHQILVCVGKGHKDRRTILPVVVKEPLVAHLEHVYQQHQHDLAHGFRRVYVPDALQRKYLSTIIEKGPDTVGEQLSTLRSPPFRAGNCMVLCLQRGQTRDAIFEAAEFANSIGPFSMTEKSPTPRITGCLV